MNDKFLDAMIEQSIQMMTDACHGKSLSKDEMAFIIATQKAEDKRRIFRKGREMGLSL